MRNPHLTEAQKAVIFGKATEQPFSGKFLELEDDGTYRCANCGNLLFDSDRKFDSGCGWPSFDQAREGAVQYRDDTSHDMVRTEVVCGKCQGHLGHVFDDGPPQTTGQRFCINSLSLDFLHRSDNA